MGHSTGVSDSYYRPTENDLLLDYLKCVDALTIKRTNQYCKNKLKISKKKVKIVTTW